MLDLIIIALFAGFLGILTYDFFTKKKTEVNGAHVVVGFHVGVLVVHSRVTRHRRLLIFVFRSLEDQVVLERQWQLNSQNAGLT